MAARSAAEEGTGPGNNTKLILIHNLVFYAATEAARSAAEGLLQEFGVEGNSPEHGSKRSTLWGQDSRL